VIAACNRHSHVLKDVREDQGRIPTTRSRPVITGKKRYKETRHQSNTKPPTRNIPPIIPLLSDAEKMYHCARSSGRSELDLCIWRFEPFPTNRLNR